MESIKKKIFKGGVRLTAGLTLTNALSLVRNIIIARMLSPYDYGIAAIFTMIITFLDILSNFSVELLLVQAPYGNDQSFQETVHYIQILRGCLLALICFTAAPLFGKIFNIASISWAFKVLAFVPLVRSFTHRDINRLQRDYQYNPMIKSEVVSGLVVTILIIPLCYYYKNYEAALYALVVQAGLITGMTHVVAERKYSVKFNRKYIASIFKFGWPLIFNSIFMFVIFQGDRFVIGSAKNLIGGIGYTVEDLAYYSVAFSLTLVPSLLIGRISNSLLLPLLSQVTEEHDEYTKRYQTGVQIVTMIAIFFVLPFIVGGNHIVYIIYGQKYLEAGEVIKVLAMMQGIRLLRYVPTVSAMSFGDTKNDMVSNIVRCFALVGVVFCAYHSYDMVWIAAFGLTGEVAALITSVVRLNIMHGVRARFAANPALLYVMLIAIAYATKDIADFPKNGVKFIAIISLYYTIAIISVMTFFVLVRQNAMEAFKSLKKATAQ